MGAMKTFVVRLFVAGQHEPRVGEPTFHGFVEEIASGRTSSFADDRELLAFLDAGRHEHAEAHAEGSSS